MSEDPRRNDDVTPSGVVLHYSGMIASAEWDKDSALGKLRNAYAQAQAANVDLVALKAARKIAGLKTDEKVLAAEKSLAKTIVYLRILRPDAFNQFDLIEYLDNDAGKKTGDEALFEEGRRAALLGTSNHAPAGYNDTQRSHWDEGWREGNREADRIREMAMTAGEEEPAENQESDLDDEEVEEVANAIAGASEDDASDENAEEAEPNSEVRSFAEEVEEEASAEEPDIPPAMDRKNWVDGKPPTTNGGQMALILGVDQSLNNTGLALWNPKEPHSTMLLHSFKSEGADIYEKLVSFRLQLRNAIKQWRPAFVAIERAQEHATIEEVPVKDLVGGGTKTISRNPMAFHLNKLEGCAIATVAGCGLRFNVVTPATWRASFLGYGRKKGFKAADWKRAAKERCQLLNINARNQDQAESAGIAVWASGSEAYRMMTIGDTQGGRKARSGSRRSELLLNGLAETWPTPAARDHKGTNSPEHLKNGTGKLHLDQLPNFVERNWATPTAHDGRRPGADPHSQQGRNLKREAENWATPATADMTGTTGGGQVKSLRTDASQWATPKAMTGGANCNREARGAGGPDLQEQTQCWATPRVHEAGAYQVDGRSGKQTPTLDGQSRSFRPDQTNKTNGPSSQSERRTLNPLFVEWLMGWPQGWTTLGLTNCACSETAFFHWRRRMESALLALPISPPEPTKQQSLFA
eukprot:g17208.t1